MQDVSKNNNDTFKMYNTWKKFRSPGIDFCETHYYIIVKLLFSLFKLDFFFSIFGAYSVSDL